MRGNQPPCRAAPIDAPANWAQIGRVDGYFAIFWLAALFAGMVLMRCSLRPSRTGNRSGRGSARADCRCAFALGVLCVVASTAAHAQASRARPAAPTANAGSAERRINCYAWSAGSDGHQSRQQFPGAARQPGHARLRQRAAQQSRRRRRLGGDRRAAAFPDLGRGLRHFDHDGRAGRFVGDHRQTYGGVAGFGATRRARRQCRSSRSTRAAPPSTFRWRCSRRRSTSPSSASTPRSTRGRGPGRWRWSMALARSIPAATPALALPPPATTARSTAR